MTLKQIAAEAGVSAMTVSNVINHNDDKVSEETRKRVQAIIDKYHYTPNMSARSLSARNSRIIAILLPIYALPPDTLPGVQGSFAGPEWSSPPEQQVNCLSDHYSSLLTGLLEAKLKSKGYYVMLRSFQRLEEVLDLQRNWQVDGCIMITPMIDDTLNRRLLQASSCPIVMIDRNYPDLPMLSVVVNDYRGGYLAAEACIRHGHRRIAFISTTIPSAISLSSVIFSRYQGYQAALRDSSIAENPELVFGFPNTYEGGKRCCDEILRLPPDRRPTAVFATSDNLAIGVLLRLREKGIRVPEEMSVIGYDDIPAASLLMPKLTTVAQNIDEKAAAAVKLLQRAIEDPEMRSQIIQIDVKLVERETIGICQRNEQ